MSPFASTQDLAVHLTALPDREVAALLVARPDLASPPSSSFLALATRAGTQGSVEQALAGRQVELIEDEADLIGLCVLKGVLRIREQGAGVGHQRAEDIE